MSDAHFLRDLAVVLGVAAVTTVLCQRIRQPVVLGYLIAGMVVGPHVPIPLVADEPTISTLAELGVILLMFSIGLKFSLRKLGKMAPRAGVVAAIQIGVMLLLGYLAGRALGWPQLDSIFTGAIVAISSTVVIAKAFEESRVSGVLSDLVIGVLIFEDLAAILLIAAFTAIGAGEGLTLRALGGTLGRLALFLGIALAAGVLVIPRMMRAIVRLRRPETTLVASIGLCFASALGAEVAGYSVALGAFIGGSLVAESGVAKQINDLILPVRDMFTAIFFVAVGMLIEPAVVAEHWGGVLLLVVVVIVGTLASVLVGAFLTGYDIRTGLRAGMSLAQIGEFSFIIAGIGVATGATRSILPSIAIAVAAVTTLTTPWLIRVSDPLSLWIDSKLPKPIQTVVSLYGTWLESLRASPRLLTPRRRARRLVRALLIDAAVLVAIVIGAATSLPALHAWMMALTGLSADTVRVLDVALVAVVGLPLVVGIFRTARRLGQALAESAIPAPPPGRVDTGLAPRRVLVVTVQIATVIAIGVPMVALTQPFMPPLSGVAVLAVVLGLLAVGFWRSASDLQGHATAGAELVAAALAKRGGAMEPALDQAAKLLPGLGHVVPVEIELTSAAVGRSLKELNVRGLTGATAVAISRGEERIIMPHGDEVLRDGDVVALTGTGEAIEAARRLLEAPLEPEMTHASL